jgi:hypothetical protein
VKVSRQIRILSVLLLSCIHTLGDVPVQISVPCPDVVLAWASQPGETFTVVYRPNLNAGTTWTTLATLLPAATGGNTTTFIHANVIPECPPPPQGGGGTNDPAPSPPNPGGSQSATSSAMSAEDRAAWREQLRLEAEAAAQYLWDLMMEASAKAEAEREQWRREGRSFTEMSSSGMETESFSIETIGSIGFYRVFRTSPQANPDFFTVEQGSGPTHLEILGNDFDPDNERFFISSITSGGQGSINYYPDGSVVQFTPLSSFYGLDTFTYTLTNVLGGRATTTINVFVNQSGNNPPIATAPLITLATNGYTAVVNPLSGTSDPDSDAVSLVAFTSARLGSVTNIGGQLNYTHPSDHFGADGFDYFLTDGKGGFTRVEARVFQTDDDSDGMADEWENRVGLNVGSNDADADPDADGLPNIAEFNLRKAPAAADNPLHLPLSNGAVVNGFVQIPLPTLTPQIEKPPIELYVNNEPAANSFISQAASGQWLLNWDTTFLPNGTYSLKAGYQHKRNVSPGQNNVIFGQSKTVVVANEIRFDPLTSKFTDFLIIDSTLARNEASYRVELHDDYGPLVYWEGTTSNGKIQLYWDLTDGAGQQISFDSIEGRFFLSYPSGSTNPAPLPTPITQWFLKETPSGNAGFVVAWGWDRYTTTFNNYREEMMVNAVINILGDPAGADEYTLAPSFNVPYASAFRYDTEGDKKILMQAFTENNNFFWIGHGSDVSIAGNDLRSSIAPADVARLLGNFSSMSSKKFPRTDKRPYRLVILNGCETYGSFWAGAFGIDFASAGSSNTTLDYQFTGRMPRAFVGWTGQGEVPDNDFTGGAHAGYGEALAELFGYWMAGFPLDFCVDAFADKALANGFDGQDTWKISGCPDLQRRD